MAFRPSTRTPTPLHPNRGAKKAKGRWEKLYTGVWVAPDGRERCTPTELANRKLRKRLEQNYQCAHCGVIITDWSACELDHIKPKSMGGAFRDDRMENLQVLCNHLLNNCHQKKTGLPQWSQNAS